MFRMLTPGYASPEQLRVRPRDDRIRRLPAGTAAARAADRPRATACGAAGGRRGSPSDVVSRLDTAEADAIAAPAATTPAALAATAPRRSRQHRAQGARAGSRVADTSRPPPLRTTSIAIGAAGRCWRAFATRTYRLGKFVAPAHGWRRGIGDRRRRHRSPSARPSRPGHHAADRARPRQHRSRPRPARFATS